LVPVVEVSRNALKGRDSRMFRPERRVSDGAVILFADLSENARSLNSRPELFSSGGVVWQPLQGKPV
jgi:hypothetical protein